MSTAPKFVAGDRRALIAKVHLGAKDMALKEDARRDLLERVTGKRSSADCTDAQLVAVLDEYRRLGWTPSNAPRKPAAAASKTPQRRPANSPMAKKARAMWISLHQLGAIRDPSEKALEAFGKRQLGVDRLQWADEGQAFRLIEALKAIAERHGWSQDLTGIKEARQVWTLQARLVNAQLRLLQRPFLRSGGMGEAELTRLAKELGAEIQASRKVGGE